MKFKCIITGARVSVQCLPSRLIKKPFLTFILLSFVGLVPNAQAIETTRASGFTLKPGDSSSLHTSPSLNHSDSCLSLLKKVRHTAASNGSHSLRRPVGKKAATVGFVLGLRIALGPTEVTGPNRVQMGPQIVQSRDSYNGQALAIADYRNCKNNQALKLINKQTRLGR